MAFEATNKPTQTVFKHNPHLWSPQELRAIFVVRQTDLQELHAAVSRTRPDQVPQHVLITGYRGMGKSTLLQRLALAIADDAATHSQWLALTFPEEQYTLSTLAEFWRNVLDALADALEREHASAEQLAALDARIEAIGQLPNAQAEAAALTLLEQWITQHRRGLVLLIDSSDQLLHTLNQVERKGSAPSNTAVSVVMWSEARGSRLAPCRAPLFAGRDDTDRNEHLPWLRGQASLSRLGRLGGPTLAERRALYREVLHTSRKKCRPPRESEATRSATAPQGILAEEARDAG